jgi:hypothetical protein
VGGVHEWFEGHYQASIDSFYLTIGLMMFRCDERMIDSPLLQLILKKFRRKTSSAVSDDTMRITMLCNHLRFYERSNESGSRAGYWFGNHPF